ncbi:MAG: purine-nucleoside phosphorylase [Acidobacteriota bacterium]
MKGVRIESMHEEFEGSTYLGELGGARDHLAQEFGTPPPTAVILGSGLGDLVDGLNIERDIGWEEVPFFPSVSVTGHEGRLVEASVAGQRTLFSRGRVHCYEGLPLHRVVFPIRALALWGVRNFVLACAAGAINVDYAPGDLMLIRDHINLMGHNPLTGPDLPALGPRFPDMTEVYSRHLNDLALCCAAELKLTLRQGVYMAVQGPSYETPAEVRMMRLLGADAVGMSTVPEALALRQMDREVMAVACLTNMAAGTFSDRLNHDEVLRVAKTLRGRLQDLLRGLCSVIGEARSTPVSR